MKTRTGITKRALFSGLMAATMLVGVGCSSGGSSSGIGSNFSGTYNGVLRAANGTQVGTVIASLIDSGVQSDGNDVTAGTVTGQIIVNSNSNCPEGGAVTGTNSFGRLQLTAGSMTLTLSNNGGGLNGIWSTTATGSTGTTGTTGTTGGTGTTPTTTASSCPAASGTIVLN